MRWIALALCVVGCAAPAATPADAPTPTPDRDASVWLRDGRLPSGERVHVRLEAGQITHVGAGEPPAASVTRDLGGAFIAPAVIDSHVHLEYLDAADALHRAGVAATVDLGAPIESLAEAGGPLERLDAGPMITARRGYPTQSWGRHGYGLEVDGPSEGAAAVETLVDAGAGVIKVALMGERGLDAATLEAVTRAAHARSRRVVAHALGAADVAKAAAAGVDALAHIPLEPLDADGAAAWRGRAVITTAAAFAPAAAADNLRQLIAAGATPIYGTDLGNTTDARISADEIRAMRAAGMGGQAIVDSMTTAPSALWGMRHGVLAVGRPACLLVLDASPTENPEVLAAPREVICPAGAR